MVQGPSAVDSSHATTPSVTVSPGALSEETTLAIAETSSTPASLELEQGAGEVHEFTPHGQTFEQPVTVRLPYSDSIPAELEPLVRIFWAESLEGPWQALPSTVDEENNTVSAEVSSFSYGIAGVSVTDSNISMVIQQQQETKVDLLFVVDNSNSMREEQAVLTDQIQIMVRELIEPTVAGGDTPPAVQDLHIGVVSPDLGVGGYAVDTCTAGGLNGDNGELQALVPRIGSPFRVSLRTIGTSSQALRVWAEHRAA